MAGPEEFESSLFGSKPNVLPGYTIGQYILAEEIVCRPTRSRIWTKEFGILYAGHYTMDLLSNY
jgi:hypothetical protein